MKAKWQLGRPDAKIRSPPFHAIPCALRGGSVKHMLSPLLLSTALSVATALACRPPEGAGEHLARPSRVSEPNSIMQTLYGKIMRHV